MSENEIILYQTPDGKATIQLHARDGSVWLNQTEIAQLFGTSKPNISMHISNVFADKELREISVVKNYLTTAADGKQYEVTYYSLEMILAIGFRVRSVRGVQFRQWANQHLREFLIKGFVMDDQRLKNPDGRPDYFDELLARIRDIRASEKRFYQKLRDLFALSNDYDPTDKATMMFFAQVQNKLLFAITGKTAAEIVVSRASADEPNMGLHAWKGNIVRKQDIIIAKNYLHDAEIDRLNRLVVIFLETAEFRAQNRTDLTMDFWRNNVDRILEMNDLAILRNNGTVSNAMMEEFVRGVYSQFDSRRKAYDAQLADEEDMAELRRLEEEIKRKKEKGEAE